MNPIERLRAVVQHVVDLSDDTGDCPLCTLVHGDDEGYTHEDWCPVNALQEGDL